MYHLSAPVKIDQLEWILEGELHGHLDYALTALVRDLAEVVDRVGIEAETPARIAHALGRAARPVGDGLGERNSRAVGLHQRQIDRRPRAGCAERQVDVAGAHVPVVKILRERLVEDIEESEAELQIFPL